MDPLREFDHHRGSLKRLARWERRLAPGPGCEVMRAERARSRRGRALFSLSRVFINAQIAALTSRLRYPAIAIIIEHSDVLFDIHNAKNDACRCVHSSCKGGKHKAVAAQQLNSILSTGVDVRANPAGTSRPPLSYPPTLPLIPSSVRPNGASSKAQHASTDSMRAFINRNPHLEVDVGHHSSISTGVGRVSCFKASLPASGP